MTQVGECECRVDTALVPVDNDDRILDTLVGERIPGLDSRVVDAVIRAGEPIVVRLPELAGCPDDESTPDDASRRVEYEPAFVSLDRLYVVVSLY